MAQFHRVPGGESLSRQSIVVEGDSLTVGLRDAADLSITNSGDGLSIMPAGQNGSSRLFRISVRAASRATSAVVNEEIFAVDDSFRTQDAFRVEFRFRSTPAGQLVVRDVTRQVFGRDEFVYRLTASAEVAMATFKPGDSGNVLDFAEASSPVVRLRAYAAKIGMVERAYWLMLPDAMATSLMIVITHGFGQQHKYYSAQGYSNPLSVRHLEDLRDRFVLSRWGLQVAHARAGMGLLLPARAASGTGGGGELGPFVMQRGLGARIVRQIAVLAHADFLLKGVGVVTFSSGIHDANVFLANNAGMLPIQLTVNQDPAGGVGMGTGGPGAARKQYLSGYTTGGPRAGFEYLPDPRWAKDPRNKEMKAALGREYLHTFAIPTYTLAMALRP